MTLIASVVKVSCSTAEVEETTKRHYGDLTAYILSLRRESKVKITRSWCLMFCIRTESRVKITRSWCLMFCIRTVFFSFLQMRRVLVINDFSKCQYSLCTFFEHKLLRTNWVLSGLIDSSHWSISALPHQTVTIVTTNVMQDQRTFEWRSTLRETAVWHNSSFLIHTSLFSLSFFITFCTERCIKL
jgi:hypothetical protein